MPPLPSVMTHQFSQIPRAEIPRSSFDRSSGYKTAFDSGLLIPIFVDEALPGDTFNLNATLFGRLATPLRPFMDNVFLNTFFFAVPLRLLWLNFRRFMGEQPNPGDSVDFLVPQIVAPAGGYAQNTIYDYMAIPTKIAGISHSALPLRAYNLIWNEWFRDQNLQTSVSIATHDGPDAAGNYVLLRRGKRHDYFTSALPWPQKGPAVNLPLGTSAPVVTTNVAPQFNQAGVGTVSNLGTTGGSPGNVQTIGLAAGGDMRFDAITGLRADLTTATAATINQLRQAFQLQKLYERDARGGTRYTEIVRAHFNVVSPDARLQRPEYLGGGQSILNVHQVAQQSASVGAGTPQGNMAAYGTVAGRGHGFTHSFTEHCVVIGLMSVRADINYQQGLNRMWSRRTKYDFYWPALAMIGEQAILNKEIYAQGTAADDLAFGYQERFAEYRYKPSVITGELRSNATLPLDTWHLAQNFASLPALNANFIQDVPPIARVIAVPTERQFILDAYFQLRCARPMPVYGVPGMIDHF